MPFPMDLSDPEIELGSDSLQVDSLPTELSGKPSANFLHRLIHLMLMTSLGDRFYFYPISQFHSKMANITQSITDGAHRKPETPKFHAFNHESESVSCSVVSVSLRLHRL